MELERGARLRIPGGSAADRIRRRISETQMIERKREMKTVLFAMVTVLWMASLAQAQTPTLIINRTIDFDVDTANYNAKLADGVTAVVQAVQFDAIGMNNNGAIAITYTFASKPAETTPGHVGPVPVPVLANLTKDKPYTGTVTLIGPNGTAKSLDSAPFVSATSIPPQPATHLVIR